MEMSVNGACRQGCALERPSVVGLAWDGERGIIMALPALASAELADTPLRSMPPASIHRRTICDPVSVFRLHF